MKYNERLYSLRTDNDLRQEDVANILKTTKQTYGRYEKGILKLSIEDLETLCKFYNVSSDYIIGLTNDPSTHWTIKNNVTINGGKNKLNFK